MYDGGIIEIGDVTERGFHQIIVCSWVEVKMVQGIPQALQRMPPGSTAIHNLSELLGTVSPTSHSDLNKSWEPGSQIYFEIHCDINLITKKNF